MRRTVRGARVAVTPVAPCVAPCGLPPGPTAYRYQAPAYYAYYKQPAYWGECGRSTCNTYWRRNCWYELVRPPLLQLTERKLG
ncbi:MAG: hypothetical protein R3D30_09585 [Hyphomicrobiales bacterium]